MRFLIFTKYNNCTHFFLILQNFTLTKEELGLTHMGDLGEADMTTTRRLALIELTALFDNCGVPMNNRRKPNVKLKSKGHSYLSFRYLSFRYFVFMLQI